MSGKNVAKEFAEYILLRMSKERGRELINSLPLFDRDKKILIAVAVDKIPQKQIAYDENKDPKTISRRYNKALEMSAPVLTAYVAKLLERPEK